MSVTPLKAKADFDDTYHRLGEAIRDAKAVANLLTAVNASECDVVAAGFAAERTLERAEGLFTDLWDLRPKP